MLNNPPPEDSQTNDLPPTSPETGLAHGKTNRKNLKRFVVILVVAGLVLGGIVSVGVVIALNRFGLTDTPAQVDQ